MRTGGLLRSSLIAGTIGIAATIAVLSVPATAQEEDGRTPVYVTLDEASVIKLERAADAVIVGNPAVADVTILDANTLVITGRSFGTTNLLALDEDGEEILNETLTVRAGVTVVTVFRRSVRETYSCSPICQPVLAVGDSANQFNQTSQQIQVRSSMASP